MLHAGEDEIARVKAALGSPEKPMDSEALAEKVRGLTGGAAAAPGSWRTRTQSLALAAEHRAMKKTAARIAVLAALSLLAIPSVASARPWGGVGSNPLGPAAGASVLLGVQNGQVRVRNVQLIITCTDAEDGLESPRAFYARFNNWENLRLNKFDIQFSANAGGRLGLVTLKGILRSNGTGAARIHVIATGTGDMGQVVERCEGRARVDLNRGGN